MKKTFSLWFNIFTTPSKGFSDVSGATPIAMPLIIVLILILAGSALLMPILSSEAYTDALSRAQINTLEERGTELTEEQIEMMDQQLRSNSVKTLTLVSSTAGAVLSYFVITIISILVLKLILLIFKEKITFKHLFKIMFILAIISAIQMLLKNGITLASDYTRVLSRVQHTAELQYALTSPVSFAALFSPQTIGDSLYYLVDAFTDIFNWLYYGFLYAALKYSAGFNGKKALIAVIVFALLMIAAGFIMTLFI